MLFGHTIKEWLWASRPWSFPASAMPVLVTLAFLRWEYSSNPMVCNWFSGFLAVIAMVLFQGAANLISDYFDFKTGVDQADTFGSKVITSGKFFPSMVLRYGIVLLVCACFIGLYLFWQVNDVRLLVLGIGGAFFVLSYSFFKFRALGDMVIFAMFSFMPILGTGLVVTGEFHTESLILAVPVGLITVAILHANNWRDVNTDERARIQTFSMLIGSRVSEWVYVLELTIPFVWVIAAVATGSYLPVWCLLSLLALPIAFVNIRRAVSYGSEADVISDLDERTAKLQLCFGSILSVSLVLASII